VEVMFCICSDDIAEANRLMTDLEPTTPQEYILKGVVNAVLGQEHGIVSCFFRSLHLPPNSQFMFVFCCKTHSYDNSRLQVPKGAGHLLHRPVDLDLNVGPSAIPCEIPVVTGYLVRVCEIS